jgi:hypothetical protein
MHPALAGAAAAAVWGLLEPLDRRLFRCDYSDVALLARLSRGGWVRGFAWHLANGAAFGVAARRLRADPLALALVEHAALWPLLLVFEPDVARSPRAFAQGTFRHAVFGTLLRGWAA